MIQNVHFTSALAKTGCLSLRYHFFQAKLCVEVVIRKEGYIGINMYKFPAIEDIYIYI